MRKLFSSGVFVFAGMVSLPLDVNPSLAQFDPIAEYRDDPRLHRLHKFFRAGHCPVAGLAHIFLDAADSYELDWRLLPSLSFVESSGGKAAPGNNLFGWDSGRAEFASMADSIFRVGYRLANSSLYRDKSLDRILATYNPNADYAAKVKSVMRRIAPAE